MPVLNRIASFQSEMASWRHDIHAHPEIAFEEHRTAEVVIRKLEQFGLEIHQGIAGTGVVATLRGAVPGERTIALRADMDALHIHERNDFAHASATPGKMHACGHDGHTTMLLGAARYLSETRNFAGTVHFIFQPAEENEAGGRRMVEEGLFDKFPVDAVYGMHNWPGLPAGQFAVRAGPMMAAADTFEITVSGKGAHAAMPYLGVDPIVVATEIVGALQTIVSRNIHAFDAAVISVTQFHAGDTWNVIPSDAVLRGTLRYFKPEIREVLEKRVTQIVEGLCAAHDARATINLMQGYPATVNTDTETELAASVISDIIGDANLRHDLLPSMGSEDFAFMLQRRPGSYVWIGNGTASHGLHHPSYDFNDEILTLGATYWARLVETALALPGA